MRKFLLIAAVACFLLYKFLCWASDLAQGAGAAAIIRDESRFTEIINQ